MSLLAFAGLGGDGGGETEAQMMERMAADDDSRRGAGAIGLPAHTVARMRREDRERGTYPGAGIHIGGRWVGQGVNAQMIGGRTVDQWDPFWGRYDAFLAQRRGGLGAETPVAAAMNSWWTIGVLALVTGGVFYWWREGEKRYRPNRRRRRRA